MDEGRPLFVQIAEMIENSIIDGSFAEEAQVPSTNELAAFHRINPATAGQGPGQTGRPTESSTRNEESACSSPPARETRMRGRRRAHFSRMYIEPLIVEAGEARN